MKYETYILPFIEQFKLVDSDIDGVLDERELKELMVAIDVWDEAERLIQKFESQNLKHLTMTEIVAVLSSETIELESGGKERVAILDKVCKDYK
jgi:Ca2+-binding EF-hand superfamily protein